MINYRIEQPIDPNFDIIDKVCVKGLLEQSPTPTGEQALRVVQGLRNSQFKIVKNNVDNIVGLVYFTINESNRNMVKIDFLYAVKKRKGIGTLLLNNVLKFAKKNKFSSILLEVSIIDNRAVEFYKAKGFIKIGKRIVNKQLTLAVMKLKI